MTSQIKSPIYLDTAASMPIFKSVQDQLVKDLGRYSGNPHGQHKHGRVLAGLIDECSHQLARSIGAAPCDIIWCSSASEANNMALKAGYEHLQQSFSQPDVYYHPLCHPSLVSPCTIMGARTLVFCPKTHQLDLPALIKILETKQGPLMINLPWGHNESGFFEDFTQLFSYLKQYEDIWIHVDAAQSLGKIPINLRELPITSMSFSGHKIGAPIGIGALYVNSRPSKYYTPLIAGGGQQQNRRSGTLSVPLIRSFTKALELNCLKQWQKVAMLKQELADFLEESGFFEKVPLEKTLGHILAVVCIKDSAKVLQKMKEQIVFSQTAACSSWNERPSDALSLLGLDHHRQKRYCRLSFPMDFDEEQLTILKNIFHQQVFSS